MQNNQDAIREAMRLAGTPAGKQLMAMLQQSGKDELQQAMRSASAGDFAKAQQLLSGVLSSPEVRKLLEQMGGQHGPNGR